MKTRGQALGQNFLHHRPTIGKIGALVAEAIDHAEYPPVAILEVGPGRLALTHELERIAERRGIPLLLVERDRALAEQIRVRCRAELHVMDAASDEFSALLRENSARFRGRCFVASNLPYSASSQILANLCHASRLLSGCVVMVQKELAQRMAAPAGSRDRGAFSLLIQSYFSVRLAFDVGPGAFTPPPKVTSTVLELAPLESPLTAQLDSPLEFERFCKALFSGRRKMIRNLIPREKHVLFPKLGISGTERPESLELTTLLLLYQGSEE